MPTPCGVGKGWGWKSQGCNLWDPGCWGDLKITFLFCYFWIKRTDSNWRGSPRTRLGLASDMSHHLRTLHGGIFYGNEFTLHDNSRQHVKSQSRILRIYHEKPGELADNKRAKYENNSNLKKNVRNEHERRKSPKRIYENWTSDYSRVDISWGKDSHWVTKHVSPASWHALESNSVLRIQHFPGTPLLCTSLVVSICRQLNHNDNLCCFSRENVHNNNNR